MPDYYITSPAAWWAANVETLTDGGKVTIGNGVELHRADGTVPKGGLVTNGTYNLSSLSDSVEFTAAASSSYARERLGSGAIDLGIATTHTISPSIGTRPTTGKGVVVIATSTGAQTPTSMNVFGISGVDVTIGSVDARLKGLKTDAGPRVFIIEFDWADTTNDNIVITQTAGTNCQAVCDVWRYNEAVIEYSGFIAGNNFIVSTNPAPTGPSPNTSAGDDVSYFVFASTFGTGNSWDSPVGVTQLAAYSADADSAPLIFVGGATGVGAATPLSLGVTKTGHGNAFFPRFNIVSRSV